MYRNLHGLATKKPDLQLIKKILPVTGRSRFLFDSDVGLPSSKLT